MEFSVKGIKIRFTFLFFWVFTLLFLLDRSGVMVLGILAALLHELGHILAFLLVHDFPKEILLEVTGIKLVRFGRPIKASLEIFQLLMGSLTNFAVFAILFFSLDSINRLSLFAVSHLTLGVFNLLPIKTLDGGKILRLLLEQKLDPRKAYLICRITSILTLIPLLLLGVYFCFFKEFHFSLLLISIWLGILCFKE